MSHRFKGLNTFHHVVMRGARGMNIVENDRDRWDFNKLLYYLNDTYQNLQWERDLKTGKCALFERPHHWPPRNPLVHIYAYSLLDNHFHLLLEEAQEGGISKFMHRLPNSMTRRYNRNYGGFGSIFQGSYRSRLIEHQADFTNVILYITVKNVLERYPHGGLSGAFDDFETAHQWALEDNFSSYPEFGGNRNSPIVEHGSVEAPFSSGEGFKKEARKYVKAYLVGDREQDIDPHFE